MAVTVGIMETSVREILMDTDEENGYRFSPAFLLRALRDGLKRLHSIRPESRYLGLRLIRFTFPTVDGDLTPDQVQSARATEIPVEERWIEAIVYYAVHKAYLIDSSDTANADLAAKYLSLSEGIARS